MTPEPPEDGGFASDLRGDATVPLAASGVATTALEPGGEGFARLQVLGAIGRGGVGEVYRVFDPVLARTVALKVLDRGFRSQLLRFVEEARVQAQLQHPGIVPIHELGTLPDGRIGFTMREIDGRTLAEVLATLHAASRAAGTWAATDDGWTLRRVLDAVLRVAEAVAYAHAHGVVHRDLKPHNVMVGRFGEVFVLDWGIAKVTGAPDHGFEPIRSGRADERATPDAPPTWTQWGDRIGTPRYMAPEQALGVIDRIGPSTDVWGLGGLLHEALTGQPPVTGTAREVLDRLCDPALVLDPRAAGAPGPVDDDLWALCAAALARYPADRPPDASVFAADLSAWLEGSRRRERALAAVAVAVDRLAEADRLRAEAAALRAQADADEAALTPSADEERLRPAWELVRRARAAEVQAALAELAGERSAGAALEAAPGLPEAHAALAAHHREGAAAAERRGDEAAAARSLALLQVHAEALPPTHAARADHLAFLRGDAAVTLITDPPGAEVWLERYVLRDRLWVAEPAGPLGRTPLVAAPLSAGSWRLRVRAPGRPEVLYPVHLGRGEHWDGIPPGGSAPHPVWIPESVPDGAVYVPAGWFLAGDPEDGLRRVWCDALFVRRFPVTLAELCAWLGALPPEEAERWAPRVPPGRHGDHGPFLLPRGPDGRFQPGRDPDGDDLLPEFPAVSMDWAGAVAHAAWIRRTSGVPWRLPAELEWEKAARGVDGRTNPWVEEGHARRCNHRDAQPRPMPAPVDSFPLDCSPYGVRGCSGNVREWTTDAPGRTPGVDASGRVIPAPLDPPHPPAGHAIGRGGGWPLAGNKCFVTSRVDDRTDYRHPGVGYRLVASVGGREDPGR